MNAKGVPTVGIIHSKGQIMMVETQKALLGGNRVAQRAIIAGWLRRVLALLLSPEVEEFWSCRCQSFAGHTIGKDSN